MYITVVEARGRSIEEIEETFNNPHPVKRSLQKRDVVAKVGEGVTRSLLLAGARRRKESC